jgi:hypothetical protein
MQRIATILFLCLPCLGASYFVDPATGNDGNAGTSQGSPWAHLPGTVGGAPAVQLQPGDTVTVKGGSSNLCSVNIDDTTYHGNAVFNSILIQSGDLAGWGTGKAIFDEQNTRFYGFGVGKGSGNAINGITIDGFEVRNIAGAGSSGAPGNPGSCCVSIQPPPSGGVPVSFVTVRRCYLHDAIRTVTDSGHGMEVGSSSNLLIYWNVVGPNIGTKGIEVSGGGGAVSNNFVTYTGDHCISVTTGTNFDVCYNTIRQDGAQVHSPTFMISVGASAYNDIYDNLLFDSQAVDNVQAWSSGFGNYNGSHDNYFYFNTIGRMGDNQSGVGSGITVSDNGTVLVTNHVFKNNMVLYTTNVFQNSFMVFVNGATVPATNITFVGNDFWNGLSGATVCGWNDGSYHYATVGAFSVPGITFSGNVSVDPALKGGAWPTGLDANFRPNTTYFMLNGIAPASVTTTGNNLQGEATHGYSHAASKFALDIVGVPRTLFSMGAYEFQNFPPVAVNINAILTGKVFLSGKVLIQ